MTGKGTATTCDSIEFVTQAGRRSGVVGNPKRGHTYEFSPPVRRRLRAKTHLHPLSPPEHADATPGVDGSGAQGGDEIVGLKLGSRGRCPQVTGLLTRRSPAGSTATTAQAFAGRPTAAMVAAASAGIEFVEESAGDGGNGKGGGGEAGPVGPLHHTTHRRRICRDHIAFARPCLGSHLPAASGQGGQPWRALPRAALPVTFRDVPPRRPAGGDCVTARTAVTVWRRCGKAGRRCGAAMGVVVGLREVCWRNQGRNL